MSSEVLINPDAVTITSIDESDNVSSSRNADPNVPLMDLEPVTSTLKTATGTKSTSPIAAAESSSSNVSTTVLDDLPSTSSSGDLDVVPGSSKDTKTEEVAAGDKKDGEEEKKDESIFECNICLDTAKDAVVSMCGHLFCWPCLHQWLETRPRRQLCPVCKAAISKDKVIPLYGRGSTNQQDPRLKVPPRPAGQRTEPEQGGFQGFGLMDGGFHMSFGIGAFPLGYLSSSFNFDGRRGNRGKQISDSFTKEYLMVKFLKIILFVSSS